MGAQMQTPVIGELVKNKLIVYVWTMPKQVEVLENQSFAEKNFS